MSTILLVNNNNKWGMTENWRASEKDIEEAKIILSKRES